MKLVITGASGFVGTEVVRQSLSHPSITSVIALTRRPTPLPANLLPNSDASKFHNVQIKHYSDYSDPTVQDAIAGADACIWTVAITIAKANSFPWEEVRKVCQEDAIAGLDALYQASAAAKDRGTNPFRFLYTSGTATERNQDEKLWYMNDYRKLRGQAENELLNYAANPERKSRLEVGIAKPGLILSPGDYVKRATAFGMQLTLGLPQIEVSQCAAAMLRECVKGVSKETLENTDLVRIAEEKE